MIITCWVYVKANQTEKAFGINLFFYYGIICSLKIYEAFTKWQTLMLREGKELALASRDLKLVKGTEFQERCAYIQLHIELL